jgi:cytochrome c biogenesis protein CcmG/thiol:disulfide interchange protein DsbE
LLVQEVAAKYPGKVTFVSENFGASKLADQFGVKGYPAVFVDGVLVAAPREFGFFGEVEGAGRYAPWRNAANQAKFKDDLSRMIDLILAGRKDLVHAASADTSQITALPAIPLTDLSGRQIAPADLAGRVVLVEFWATWCPPCRSTLEWLGTLKAKYRDKFAILALAVESPEAGVRSTAAALNPDVRWAITDPATARSFGDITAVPTMFVFDRAGKTARVLFGAPPRLHEDVGKLLDGLLR